MATQKTTAKQHAEKVERQREKFEKAAAQAERRERLKRIGIAAICIIFALALALPTMALSLLGGN